jgi:hypothetical protein
MIAVAITVTEPATGVTPATEVVCGAIGTHSDGTGNGGYTRHRGCVRSDWHAVRGSESKAGVAKPHLTYKEALD